MRTQQRLLVPTKSVLRPPMHVTTNRAEVNADAMFSFGAFQQACEEYTFAIRQKPTIQQYAKRCAAYAHLGDYRRAMADAMAILEFDRTNASAKVRRLA